MLIDRWMVHRSAARKLRLRFSRVDVEWLPAYAPDLNPVEQVWNRSKYVELANFIPNDVAMNPSVFLGLCHRDKHIL